MPKVRVVNREAVQCMVVLGKEGEAFEMVPGREEDDPSAPKVWHHHPGTYPDPGTEPDLQMFESILPPHTVAESHAHLKDEIIYVLEGEMRVGAKHLKAGDSIYVSAETLYGFKAGPDGLRFLNFRAARDDSHLSSSQLLDRRRQTKGLAGPNDATTEGGLDN